MKKAEKAHNAQMTQANKTGGVPQDQTMVQRWFRPYDKMKDIHSSYDGKPYNAGGNLGLREYQATEFGGQKSAPVKDFYTKSYIGTANYGSKDKSFGTDASSLANKTDAASDATFNSKKYNAAEKDFIGKHNNAAIADHTYGTKSTSVPGAKTQDQLQDEAKALQQKIEKGELSIDQIRELLNKPQ